MLLSFILHLLVSALAAIVGDIIIILLSFHVFDAVNVKFDNFYTGFKYQA